MQFISIKRLCMMALLLITAIIIGTLSMIAVYSLPTNLMFNNIKKAIPLYQKEGVYPVWTGDRKKVSSKLDNFTDAIMLGEVIYPRSKSVIRDAMLVPRIVYQNSNYVESLINQLQKDKKKHGVYTYGRYWHGYLTILKPLTMFAEVSSIRLLNLIVQVLLAAYLTMLIGIKLGRGFGISYLLSYLVLNPVSLAMSFQYSSMYYVMSFVSLILLLKWNKLCIDKNFLYLFFLAGIATAFFDLLTYPLISLGIPLIILLVRMNDEKITGKMNACIIVLFSSVYWGIGYVGMHLGKWVVAWWLTGTNIVFDAFQQLQYRMSYSINSKASYATINPISSITRNLQVIVNEPIFLILMVALLISLWKLFQRKNLSQRKNNLSSLKYIQYSLFVVAIYPFIWCSILCNHTFIHFWFTYRTLTLSVFAIGCFITTLFFRQGEEK